MVVAHASHRLVEEVGRIKGSLEGAWDELVSRLVAANIIDPDRVEGFLTMLRGAIVILTVNYLYCGRELGKDHARRVVNDLIDGFGHGPRRRAKR